MEEEGTEEVAGKPDLQYTVYHHAFQVAMTGAESHPAEMKK